MFWQKSKYLLLGLLLYSFTSLSWATVDVMELDGNVVDFNDSPSLIDWQTVNGGSSPAIATFFQKDKDVPGVTDKIFWKGGSKDELDITSWAFRSGSPQPKDDFTNGYAAAFDSGGDLLLYFGADRYANNGDMYIGFWLLQDDVGIPSGTARGSFNGMHIEGDILILVSFPQSAAGKPYIQVLEWVDSGGDVSANLKNFFTTPGDPKDPDFEGALCGGSNDQLVCAISNLESIPLPNVAGWDYEAKTGETTDIPFESFVEGRLNLTQLFLQNGLEVPCFSSFLVESRASRSIDASLADFVVGGFELCSISIAASCNTVSFNQDGTFNIDYLITVKNDGPGSLDVDGTFLTKLLPSTRTTSIDNSGAVPGTLGSVWDVNETFSISGTYVSGTNGAAGTINGSVTLGQTFIAADAINFNCPALPLTPLISIEKECETFLASVSNQVVLKKTYSIEVCNTGDVPLNVTSLTDSKDTSFDHGTFDLDFAEPCTPPQGEEPDSCGAGNTCSMLPGGNGIYGCKVDGGDWIGNFGGSVCVTKGNTYMPSDLPSGEHGKLTNQANVKADSIFVPYDEIQALAEIGQDSNVAECYLCPYPSEPQNRQSNN